MGENTEGKGMLKSIEACRGAPPQRVLLFAPATGPGGGL